MATGNQMPDRNAAVLLASDQATAESIARRDESLANVRRIMMYHDPQGPEAFQDAASEADARQVESAQKRDELFQQTTPFDPEGTAPTLADRSGNFAPSAEVAAAGGVGVDSSNTNVDTGNQAQSADEAGVQVLTGVTPVLGRGGVVEQPQGDGDKFDYAKIEEGMPGDYRQPQDTAQVQRMGKASRVDASADVPGNWRDMRWPERRSLASRLSDEPIRNAEDADRVIAAAEAEQKGGE